MEKPHLQPHSSRRRSGLQSPECRGSENQMPQMLSQTIRDQRSSRRRPRASNPLRIQVAACASFLLFLVKVFHDEAVTAVSWSDIAEGLPMALQRNRTAWLPLTLPHMCRLVAPQPRRTGAPLLGQNEPMSEASSGFTAPVPWPPGGAGGQVSWNLTLGDSSIMSAVLRDFEAFPSGVRFSLDARFEAGIFDPLGAFPGTPGRCTHCGHLR